MKGVDTEVMAVGLPGTKAAVGLQGVDLAAARRFFATLMMLSGPRGTAYVGLCRISNLRLHGSERAGVGEAWGKADWS